MPPAEQSRQDPASRLTLAITILLFLLALGSAAVGAVNALHRSQDFQWSGAHLLAQHVDPWAEYLRGDPDHRLIVTQIPNYLAVLYVLLLPLGLLSVHTASFVWMLCNLFFAIGSGILVARANGLHGRSMLVVVCLLLTATATRNTIGNGQQGLLVLFLWCLILPPGPKTTAARALLGGLSYLKFSFAPPLFLYLLLRGGKRAALYSLLPMVTGVVVVWTWIPSAHGLLTLFNLALEPFEVARTGFIALSGDQDLMYLLQSLFQLDVSSSSQGLEFAATSAICLPLAYLAFHVHRFRSPAWHMSVLAIMSYSLFKHHSYDAVVLIFPLCYALKRGRTAEGRLVLGLIAYLFYGQRILEAAHLHPRWSYIVEFALLMTILVTTYRMREYPRYAAIPLQSSLPAYEEVALAG